MDIKKLTDNYTPFILPDDKSISLDFSEGLIKISSGQALLGFFSHYYDHDFFKKIEWANRPDFKPLEPNENGLMVNNMKGNVIAQESLDAALDAYNATGLRFLFNKNSIKATNDVLFMLGFESAYDAEETPQYVVAVDNKRQADIPKQFKSFKNGWNAVDHGYGSVFPQVVSYLPTPKVLGMSLTTTGNFKKYIPL